MAATNPRHAPEAAPPDLASLERTALSAWMRWTEATGEETGNAEVLAWAEYLKARDALKAARTKGNAT